MCASNILIFGLQHCFWREDSGSTRRGWQQDLETGLLTYLLYLFTGIITEAHYPGNCLLQCHVKKEVAWEVTRESSLSVVLLLKSVTGLYVPGTETQIQGWGQGQDVRWVGGGISPGVTVLRKYLTDCSICQHCLIHMSNNISRTCPVRVPFQKD